MPRSIRIVLRNFVGLFLAVGLLVCGSNARAQSVPTQDALWAWGGGDVSICQNPLALESKVKCFVGLSGWDLGVSLITTDGEYIYAATKDQGWAYKCDISDIDPPGCSKILIGPFSSGESLQGIVASPDHPGKVWIAVTSGSGKKSNNDIWTCPTSLQWPGTRPSKPPTECIKLNNSGRRVVNHMVMMKDAYNKDWLYVGFSYDGDKDYPALIWKCEITNDRVGGCTDFNNSGKFSVNSLAIGAGYLWAGRGNGILWRCDLYNPNSCSDWNKTGASIYSVSYDGQGLVAAGGGNFLYSIPTSNPFSGRNTLSSGGPRYLTPQVVADAGNIFSSAFWDSSCFACNDYYSVAVGNFDYASSVALNGYVNLLYVPSGGPTTLGSVNLSVPLQASESSPALTSGSTPALAANSAELAKLAKRCERGGRVEARVLLEGPYGSVKRNVNLCKFIRDGRPQVNFAALDRERFYKVTARVERFYGEATFYLDKNDELKDVSIELKRRGK